METPVHVGEAAGLRIAFVQAEWHADIVDGCRDAFLAEMVAENVNPVHLDCYRVPGAFELPLHAQRLATGHRHAAVVCAGFVVDGGIYRHEFVADTVVGGLMRVQLDTGVPVLSAVLTPHHFHDHADHAGFFLEHMEAKGREVAQACVRTLRSLDRLSIDAAA